MHVRPGSHLICFLLGLGLLAAGARDARADFAQCDNLVGGVLPDCSDTITSCCKRTFPAVAGKGAIIIPQDRCHQRVSGNNPPGSSAPRHEVNLSSWTRTGSTITVTTSANHNLLSNNTDYVRISESSTFASGNYEVRTGNRCSPTCTTTTFQFTASPAAASGSGGKVLVHNIGQGWCVDPSPATDNGMFRSYGLVYRLMQRAIPVYWIVNQTKAPPAMTSSQDYYIANDVDLWVLSSDLSDPPTSAAGLAACGAGCTAPIRRLNSSLGTAATYSQKQFPVRGSAFVIAPEDRAKFDEFWTRTGAYASLASQSKYDWAASGIDLYEVHETAKIVHHDFTNGSGTSTQPFATLSGAPVAVKIDYEPPRIACLGCNSANPSAFLAKAGLNDQPTDTTSCLTGEFVPADAVYCVLNDSHVSQGALVNGGFVWAWVFGLGIPSAPASAICSTPAQLSVFDKFIDFMTTVPAVRNAGHTIFLDSAVRIAEGCKNKQLLGRRGDGTSFGLGMVGNQNDANESASTPYVIRYPANLFSQHGDIRPQFAAGNIAAVSAYQSTAARYQAALAAAGSSLRRLTSVETNNTSLCLQRTSTASCDGGHSSVGADDITDLAVYGRLGNLLINGVTYYLPGNQLGNDGAIPELRMLLNSVIALPDESFNTTPTELEIARSSPIVAKVDDVPAVYQGTYVRLDPVPQIPKATTLSGLTRFTFPYLKGHLRAIPTDSFCDPADAQAGLCDTTTQRTALDSFANVIFDAYDGIPTPSVNGCTTNFAGSCRTVFTRTATGRTSAAALADDGRGRVMFSTANMNTLGPIIASNLTNTERELFMSRILAGSLENGVYVPRLGGIDRSTPAVIGPSPIAGSQTRPTMVYFGAMDGMLHAVCASVNAAAGCDAKGRELWAFIPRTLLPELRQGTARVDGSPHVIDAFGDWDNNPSTPNTFATILIFHTGTGRMTASNVVPAVYAIDITVPSDPKVLWEYAVTNVASRTAYEMGVGLNISAGTMMVGTTRTPVAFVQTNNGGTGGAASVVVALDVETGAEIWKRGDLLPTGSGGNSARNSNHEGAPASGIPGGAVAIDKTGNGFVTHVVYGTLYGDVYVRDAVTGVNQNTNVPLFRMSVDYRPIGVPPAIYSQNGIQYAAFVTGGYVDSQSTLWTGSNEATQPTQMAFAVSLNHTATTSLTENSTVAQGVPWKFNLGANEGGFAQIMIIGGQLFVVTDSTNVNSYDYGTGTTATGKVYSHDFTGTATGQSGTTVAIAGGAASLFNNGAELFSVSGQSGQRIGNAAGTAGTSVDPMSSTTNTLTRRLWLRTE